MNETGDGCRYSYEESVIEDDELENLQRWAGAEINENNEDTGIELEDVEDEITDEASEIVVLDKVNHSKYRLVLEISRLTKGDSLTVLCSFYLNTLAAKFLTI